LHGGHAVGGAGFVIVADHDGHLAAVGVAALWRNVLAQKYLLKAYRAKAYGPNAIG
jgi:hypothetical protein